MFDQHDIYSTHQLLKTKKVSSEELTNNALQKIQETPDNAFISVLAPLARVQAKKADQLFAEGKVESYLQGIPYSLKDLFITENIRTTAGSRYLANYIPPYQGYIAGQLSRSAAVLVGKVGCDEFGMGSTNRNTAFGEISNPLNLNATAGGSSGGSAASVASGSCYFSIGTDTGGSIRLPANFCRLVGYKPSYGRISRFGQIAYGSSLDQASPIAKSVLDISCIAEEISGHDSRDASQIPLGPMKLTKELSTLSSTWVKKKKLAFDPTFIEQCNPGVQAALHKTLQHWTRIGGELQEIKLPHLKFSVAVYYLIATSEASANLARYDGIHFGHRSRLPQQSLEDTYAFSRSEGLGEEVKKRIMLGTFALSAGFSDQFFIKAAKVRRLIKNDFTTAFKNCDFIFSPVCVSTAFLKESLNAVGNDSLKEYMNDLYTIPVNLAGLPALAIPFGQDETAMPTGFQFIGKDLDDDNLLRVGRSWEQSFGT